MLIIYKQENGEHTISATYGMSVEDVMKSPDMLADNAVAVIEDDDPFAQQILDNQFFNPILDDKKNIGDEGHLLSVEWLDPPIVELSKHEQIEANIERLRIDEYKTLKNAEVAMIKLSELFPEIQWAYDPIEVFNAHETIRKEIRLLEMSDASIHTLSDAKLQS
jgi:hypothetical protein